MADTTVGEISSGRYSVSSRRTADRPTIIYSICDPSTGDVRYVGKTSLSLEKRKKRHSLNAAAGIRRHLYNWWRSLADGLSPTFFELEIVPPGGDWVEAEQRWIAFYRAAGAVLANQCDGGQGTVGIKFTDEHREKIRQAHIGRKIPAAVLEKRSIGLKAAWQRNPASRQTAESNAKRQATRAARRALGLFKKRRSATEETKAKISAAKKGATITPEQAARLADALKRKLTMHSIVVNGEHFRNAAELGRAVGVSAHIARKYIAQGPSFVAKIIDERRRLL